MYGLGLTMMVLPVSRAGMILPRERMMGKFHLRSHGQQAFTDEMTMFNSRADGTNDT